MNSNNFFQLVADFQKNIDWLNQVLKGGEGDSVVIDSVTKPSISKDIADKWAGISAMVQGRLAYETKAKMDSAGAPPSGTVLAEVWKDATPDNNGLYGWNGSAWEKSVYDMISAVNTIKGLSDNNANGVLGGSLYGNSNNLYGPADHENYRNFISLSGISRVTLDGVNCLYVQSNQNFSKDLNLADFPSGYISFCCMFYKYGAKKSDSAFNRVVVFQHDENGDEITRAERIADHDVEKQWLKVEAVEILPNCKRLRFYIETYRSEVYVSHIGIFDGMDAGYRNSEVNGNMWPDNDYSGFGIESDLPSFPEQDIDSNGRFQYKLPIVSSDRVYMWRYYVVSPFNIGRVVNFKGEFKNASHVGALIAEIQFRDINGDLVHTASADANNTLDWESFGIADTIPDGTHYIRFGWRQRGNSIEHSYIRNVAMYSSESVRLPVLNSNQIIDQIEKQVGKEVASRPTWKELRTDDNRTFANLIRDPVNFVNFNATLNKGYIDDVYCGILGVDATPRATITIPQSHFRNETGSFGIKLAENSGKITGRILLRMMQSLSTELNEYRVTYNFTEEDVVEKGATRDKWRTIVIPNFRVPNETVKFSHIEIYIDAGDNRDDGNLAFCDPWITSAKVYNPIDVMGTYDDYWVDPTMLGNQSDGRGENLPATNPNGLNAFKLESDGYFTGRYYRFSAGGAWQEGARLHLHAEMHISEDSFAVNANEIAVIYRDEDGTEITRQSIRTSEAGVWQSRDIALAVPVGTRNFEVRCGARGDEGSQGKVTATFRNIIVADDPQTSPWRKLPHGGGSVNPSSGTKQVYVGPGGDDANDGSRASPYATGARAAQDVQSGGIIKMLDGTYKDFSIPMASISGSLTVTAESMGRPRILYTSGELQGTWIKQGGATNVWHVGGISSYNEKYIWEHETPQHPIVESERHPLQRGRTHRLPSFRLYKVASIAECDANQGTWFYDSADDRLYIHNSDSTDPNARTYYRPTNQGLFTGNHSGVHGTVKKLDVWYGRYDVTNLASFELHDIRNVGGAGNGCDRGRTSGIENRCEYGGNGNDGGNAHNSNSDWDGPSGDVPPASTVTSVDMYCHDNYDDGDSLHERCEGAYIGGLWEYNGDRGIATSYGAHVTLTNGLARHNGQYPNELGQNRPGSSAGGEGFACVGGTDPKEGGVGTQMSCFSCVSYGNNLNFALNRGGNNDRMDCVNCVSEDAQVAGYSVEHTGNIMTLRNCTDKDSPLAKREVSGGQIIVKNGGIVT